MKTACLFIGLLFSLGVKAQLSDTAKPLPLREVLVTAYATEGGRDELPAALSYIGNKQLNRFGNTGLLQAVNATPGVRMEERSPGSYRLAIRGSALRSPFGVRNIKVYYNDIPFTDPGGGTYLNQIGFYNIASLEIIKGPAGSIYGAGTGGTLLLHTTGDEDSVSAVKAGYIFGSKGLSHYNAELNLGKKGIRHTLRYQHLQSEGYRTHTAMSRDVLSWDARVKISAHNSLSAHMLYSDLYYQTPGGLTRTEFEQNPYAARPAAGAFPGAEDAKAAIFAKGLLSGITNRLSLTDGLNNTTTLYMAATDLRNPTIQNYGRNIEPHYGFRSVFDYKVPIRKHRLHALAGVEWQQGTSSFKTYKNLNGNPDTLLLDDEVTNRQYFLFGQLGWQYRKWSATAGLSITDRQLRYTRLNSYPSVPLTRTFGNTAPRVALLFHPARANAVYINIAKGFSPPTTAELLPTGLNFNRSLRDEQGINYELGARGLLWNRLRYDASVFYFALRDAIVVRRDAGGGNYFVNAGGTTQPGAEAWLSYKPQAMPGNFLLPFEVFAGYTYYRFSYTDFIREATDLSGNPLPGVAPHTVVVGLDMDTRVGIYFNTTFQYTDKIPLNDAATVYADAYKLLNARLGYRKMLRKRLHADMFIGGDNLLNEVYSLGNDINAFGGRFYNTAAGATVYAGIILGHGR